MLLFCNANVKLENEYVVVFSMLQSLDLKNLLQYISLCLVDNLLFLRWINENILNMLKVFNAFQAIFISHHQGLEVLDK